MWPNICPLTRTHTHTWHEPPQTQPQIHRRAAVSERFFFRILWEAHQISALQCHKTILFGQQNTHFSLFQASLVPDFTWLCPHCNGCSQSLTFDPHPEPAKGWGAKAKAKAKPRASTRASTRTSTRAKPTANDTQPKGKQIQILFELLASIWPYGTLRKKCVINSHLNIRKLK